MIDFTINLGTILQTFAIIGSAVIFIIKMQSKMVILENKVEVLSTHIEKLSEVTIDLATQDQRLLHLEAQQSIINKYLFETKLSA